MPDSDSVSVSFESLFDGKMPQSPFFQWHLRRKTEAMLSVFDEHLPRHGRFLDVACGDGDALVLARSFAPALKLWGLDINPTFLEAARERVPDAELVVGDMLDMRSLGEGSFECVHEYGATCFLNSIDQLSRLADQYLRLLGDGGVLLWELPERWSTAHIHYLGEWAPKNTEADTKLKRVMRSFSPNKYFFPSKAQVRELLARSPYANEVVAEIPIWHFFCPAPMRPIADALARKRGDAFFDRCEALNGRLMPRLSGYYLIIRRA